MRIQAPYRNQAPTLVPAAPEVPVQLTGQQSALCEDGCQDESSGERRDDDEQQQQNDDDDTRLSPPDSQASFGAAIPSLAGTGMPADRVGFVPHRPREKNRVGDGRPNSPCFAFPRPPRSGGWACGRSNDRLAARLPFFKHPQPAHPETAPLLLEARTAVFTLRSFRRVLISLCLLAFVSDFTLVFRGAVRVCITGPGAVNSCPNQHTSTRHSDFTTRPGSNNAAPAGKALCLSCLFVLCVLSDRSSRLLHHPVGHGLPTSSSVILPAPIALWQRPRAPNHSFTSSSAGLQSIHSW